ncbi:MAG: hypothetical protein ABIC91_01360 [Nanoarchaeota archaeon]|nr:hypothetical protein [Nanoarchaeota archaeon]MBU1029871.1 hypothetical protein [Nanoarchaeota archaeon]MBU1849279.1 hypothetical protein [Nanoarchaeota archaeon]
MIKRKKAQVQMGESFAIIIIVIIMIVLGLIFYSKIKSEDISKKELLFDELSMVELAQIAGALPEIHCSSADVSDSNCIDLLKINALEEIITSSSASGGDKTAFYYYREIFGRGKIMIREIGLDGTINEWILYKTDNESLSQNTIFSPVSIYNPSTNTKSFGMLIITKYT